MKKLTVEEIAKFCKRKGFIYPSGEIYGGLAGFFDFGHLGVELKNNIKQQWWRTFVQNRQDIAGIDGAIISHPNIWKASGHVDHFEDILVEDTKTKQRFRADHLVEDALKKPTDGLNAEQLHDLIKEHNITSPGGNPLSKPQQFNLMFSTHIGPTGDNKSYLRPETAQLIFANFKLVTENARMKLPFGIAQMGKSFRNEISPRDFIFRCRELEQMEIEFFVHPDKANVCDLVDEVQEVEVVLLTKQEQEKEGNVQTLKISQAIKQGIIKNNWHAYWMGVMLKWFTSLGASKDNFRFRQHTNSELSHYAQDTWDLEYHFPFGWKELQGFADRQDFDLQQHRKHSGADLSVLDGETKKKVVPHVVCEPALGVERCFLVFLCEAYQYDKERDNIVLQLHPQLSPYKIGVFPLVKNKQPVVDKAKEVFAHLQKHFVCVYDEAASVGRRYARNDEMGTPFCVTIDFESLEDNCVTIRERDSTTQVRVDIVTLVETMSLLLSGDKKIESVGKKI